MNKKHLVLLSLGIYSLSMPLMVQAADPVIPMIQQEQLQQDRDAQRERSLRLDEERVETVVSEPALIDVP
ncbi:MAG: ShlB/FhaC/HecB family hemolysin secretion/activation protein, partial [Veillonella caviae]|nr:ShlB/FhaC/HecB family hemolysin secretion/activation protein [Veillonella caviae]